ncbi:cupin domain-containing protein [Vibrio ulleungensis]|uniref:Cupin domain-containing protein n=1 Tax=Vibrio ulleungensis TaxID=2807619 RepID=A0ABS2HG75_9VIBR|nr:cupin domain-containing protein [Vibrio ulleungensis]MBM7036101.1 cupin domain-containing protein [Vibrio ulleungensis]
MSNHIKTKLNGNTPNATSFITVEPNSEFVPLDFQGWRGRAVEASGLFSFMFDIEPGAQPYPLHTDPAEWLAVVVTGSGVLLGGSEPDNELCQQHFVAGDYITFEAGTPHAWRNDQVHTQILFVKVAS